MAGIRRVVLVGMLAILAGCTVGEHPTLRPIASSPTDAAATDAAAAERTQGWRSDLTALVPGMDRLHPRLDHGTPRADLEAAAADLALRVPRLSDDELLVGVARIVAMVSAAGCDAHTGVFAWGSGAVPVTSLPLRLWVFGDAIRVVDALPPDLDLIGALLDRIAGLPIEQVRAAVEPLIPRDNDATVSLLLPRFLLMPEVLRGLDIAGPGPIQVDVTLADGTRLRRAIEPIPMADYNAWSGPYGLHLPADATVPYLARIDTLLWWDLGADGTAFVQWNRVEPVAASDIDQIRALAGDPGTRRVVLDLRHNYGGEVSAVGPMADLIADPSINGPGRLFVITGRNTFSAASLLVARLRADTAVTIVGEAMGGCPTAWGDADPLRLPYSGIEVSVARQLEIGVSPDDTRATIEPDIPAPLTFEAWQAGRDPALDAIARSVP